jgi:hypothetical protein
VIGDIFVKANILPDREEELEAISTYWIKVMQVMLLDLREVHIEGGDVMLYNDYLFWLPIEGRTMQIILCQNK